MLSLDSIQGHVEHQGAGGSPTLGLVAIPQVRWDPKAAPLTAERGRCQNRRSIWETKVKPAKTRIRRICPTNPSSAKLLLPFDHQLHTLGPAGDDLVQAERGRRATDHRGVEELAVGGPARVVHCDDGGLAGVPIDRRPTRTTRASSSRFQRQCFCGGARG